LSRKALTSAAELLVALLKVAGLLDQAEGFVSAKLLSIDSRPEGFDSRHQDSKDSVSAV
jgi:hypothetical protein